MRTTPTPIQVRILQYVQDFQRDHDCAPTVAEMTRHFEWKCRRSAQDQLESLEKKGLIARGTTRARSISVVAL